VAKVALTQMLSGPLRVINGSLPSNDEPTPPPPFLGEVTEPPATLPLPAASPARREGERDIVSSLKCKIHIFNLTVHVQVQMYAVLLVYMYMYTYMYNVRALAKNNEKPQQKKLREEEKNRHKSLLTVY
jgi:hypothetical protein